MIGSRQRRESFGERIDVRNRILDNDDVVELRHDSCASDMQCCDNEIVEMGGTQIKLLKLSRRGSRDY